MLMTQLHQARDGCHLNFSPRHHRAFVFFDSMPKRQQPPAAANALGVDVPELRQARALWGMNRFDDSLQMFELAVRKYPQNLLVLVDASRALGTRFEIARAEDLLDQLIRLGGRNPQVLHLAGQSYRMIQRPDKAIACFQQALARSKEIPDAHLELAVLYERRHRLDDALACVNECLRIDPDYMEAALFKARLLRRLKDEAGFQRILRGLTDDDRVHPFIRAQAWTELAQAHDRAGEYEAAMQAMLRGKELLRADEKDLLHESRQLQKILGGIANAVTPEHFRRWADAAKAFPLQNVALLTGFPRTGTTLLEQVLDSHPGLVSSDEREAFARDIFPAMWMSATTRIPSIEALDTVPADRLKRQRERYLTYMAAALNEPIGHRVHLDKNPPFTLLIPAVLRLFPEMKLLIALRDPRDVVLSCFMQYLPLNTNSVCYLTLERTAERYAFDMGVWRRLREILPACWLEVRYEDVVADLEREARRALGFLDLPWDSTVLDYRGRLESKAVASPTYEAVRKPIYKSSVGRWEHYANYFEPVLPVLRPFIGAFGYAC
jgi:tetratricopeptide (TPR) repeat protein